MRFRRWPRVTSFEATPLKRAGLERSQRRQRDKLPLLAGLIAETQPSVDEEMTRRAEYWPKLQQKERDDRAKLWRRARNRLFEYEQPVRAAIRATWRGCPYPADPVYLLDLLHQINMGKTNPHRPPWIYFQQAVAPVTADATRFIDEPELYTDFHASDIASYVKRFGIEMLGTGVTSEQQIISLLEDGISLAQGSYIAGPGPVRSDLVGERRPPIAEVKWARP